MAARTNANSGWLDELGRKLRTFVDAVGEALNGPQPVPVPIPVPVGRQRPRQGGPDRR